MRQPSSSAPTPGRRHQPARLSHTRSWSAVRRRRLARLSSASNKARSRPTSQLSRGPRIFSSDGRSWRTSLPVTSCACVPKIRSISATASGSLAAREFKSFWPSALDASALTAMVSEETAPRTAKGSNQDCAASCTATQRTSSVPTSLMQACNCTSTCAAATPSGAGSTVASGGSSTQPSPISGAICPACTGAWLWLLASKLKRTACPSLRAKRRPESTMRTPSSVPRGSRQRPWGVSPFLPGSSNQ